ncbi:MAG TPA: MFS transporter, partial [Candidatus Binatia bacterium]
PTSILVVRMYGHRSVGILYGSLQVTHQLGMAAGAYLAGVVYDGFGSYYPVFAAATAIAAVATAGMFRIDERRRPYFEEEGS